MNICRTIEEARIAVRDARAKGHTISFVPTMGALHEGHLSLLKLSCDNASFRVMSIFVNKIQFNDPKDFDKYPRDYDQDIELIAKNGCDMVFLPDDSIMYHHHLTYVVPEKLDAYLCGASRPGHFKGVCTVVAKLFNIIQPDIAFFGQKDIQQVMILRKMVTDLNFPVDIRVAPIIREKDGLAMSSRNALLSPDEKTRALSIHQSLKKAEECIRAGETDCAAIESKVRSVIEKNGTPERIDYITIVDYETLVPVSAISRTSVLAVAVYFGNTRLIDNMIITPGDNTPCAY